jgi:hypothetical protein
MDKMSRYRALCRRIVCDIAKTVESQQDRLPKDLETVSVCDNRAGQYLLMNIGWQDGRRVRGTTVHLRLKDGKIWIEDDMTNLDIADRLVEAGVPKKDIVLGFQPPERRKYTEFAAA